MIGEQCVIRRFIIEILMNARISINRSIAGNGSFILFNTRSACVFFPLLSAIALINDDANLRNALRARLRNRIFFGYTINSIFFFLCIYNEYNSSRTERPNTITTTIYIFSPQNV